MTEIAIFFLRFFGYLFVLIGGVIGLIAAVRKYQTETKRKALLESELSERFLKQFNEQEIGRSLSGYVVPHCSPADPSNKEGEEFLADTREPLFSYMDRNIENVTRSYHILLADTGMGKTTFCLNYFAHVRRKFPKINVCLVSLASNNYDATIRSISDKSNTLLLADAFDEDAKGWSRGRDRLNEVLEAASDFRCVIITCRSQYFMSEDSIPRETPLPVLVPRKLGQSPTFSLVRSYISPFGKREIAKYIGKHFPVLYFWRYPSRRRAWELVGSVPDLAYRPMLLERLPDLARKPTTSREIYDLYELLVDGWFARESRWIDADSLKAVSTELALQMYRQLGSRTGRLKPDEIEYVARTKLGESPDWKHLTSRSLLNRDSQGNYKFAHKSILEFLVVKAACEGENSALSTVWTPFMKELFISWGHTDGGRGHWQRAQAILRSAEGRANIAPLFDMLGAAPVRGLPNFKRCANRRITTTGERLAPASWRASAIEVFNIDGRGVLSVEDREFNLHWSYIPSAGLGPDLLPVKLIESLHFLQARLDYRVPSYEQFVTLVEGLYRVGKNVIPSGPLFLLGDKPAKNEHLLVQINSDVLENDHLRCVDRQRRVAGTSVYLNTYLTGISVSPSYAANITIDQLYIEEKALMLV